MHEARSEMLLETLRYQVGTSCSCVAKMHWRRWSSEDLPPPPRPCRLPAPTPRSAPPDRTPPERAAAKPATENLCLRAERVHVARQAERGQVATPRLSSALKVPKNATPASQNAEAGTLKRGQVATILKHCWPWDFCTPSALKVPKMPRLPAKTLRPASEILRANRGSVGITRPVL